MSHHKSPTTRSSPDGDGHDQAHGHHVDRCGHRAGWVLCLPELQGAHHQPGNGLDGQSTTDRLHHDGRPAGLAAAGGGGRQPAGGDAPAGAILLRLRSEDDVAKLLALQATADLAQVAYDRDVKQLKAQAISQAIVDNDTFNLKNARAQVEQQKAIVDKKTLRAPFAGHLGIRAVDLGQYLNPGTVVVTLQALDPIYADFFLPQQALDQVKIGQAITAHVDTYPGQAFAGKITAINPQVDTGSRNVQKGATLSNPDRKLLPGMFATVDIDVGAPQRHITLPQTAIAYNPYGSTVYLVEQNGAAHTAKQTFVTTGTTRGDQVAVLTGVKEGDTVV